ncbi:MAG: nucleotidyltransferase domain-containing protein [Lachnospiraceae bacterium]|nr:nucleotidyltransferase domain-containing protein [Lachnospiraceae bacterium]
MIEQVYSQADIKLRIVPVLERYGVTKAILFGSYGKGSASAKSDVDILVDSGLKGLSFVGLVESIREALEGKTVDVFDVSHIMPESKIDSEIKKTGIVIYAK